MTSIHKLIIKDGETEKTGFAKTLIILALLLMAVFSQNYKPIHIAFIPLLESLSLHVMNLLKTECALLLWC
ncbi:hypothetical protein [Paenisporosarcina indica]|uniref:hypothetical protein n=1 Tax=Paenisporosarcina indica TaxID=650093 RepID=UPI001FE3DAD8|nr:hypothetical protein [Paenisporosarcina indica]